MMAAPGQATTPWGRALDAVLADGEWHDGAELISAVAAAIPPGRAHRRGEHLRGEYAPPAAPRTRGDDQTSVSTGANDIARRAVAGRVQRGTVERDGDRYRKAR